MNAELAALLRGWALSMPHGALFEEIQTQLEYLFEELYIEYEPTRGAHLDFWERLNQWLNNVPSEDDKKILLQLIPYIFFLGPREMECLYRASFKHQIFSWLIESITNNLGDPTLPNILDGLIESSWFCPITDSMRINAFYHYNGLVGRDYRPDWRSLAEFGDISRIEAYIARENIERIVLLEDFVGSGSQMFHAVKFAARLPLHLPVLVVPLVISPTADRVVNILTKRYSNVAVRPVLTLSPSSLIKEDPSSSEIQLANSVRLLAKLFEPQMIAGLAPPAAAKWYGPFGFDKSGALIVMHTNCPDNALPLIHHVAPQWRALFPRSSRI
jgi:hypothetical protein